jgi:hypothetical protein
MSLRHAGGVVISQLMVSYTCHYVIIRHSHGAVIAAGASGIPSTLFVPVMTPYMAAAIIAVYGSVYAVTLRC